MKELYPFIYNRPFFLILKRYELISKFTIDAYNAYT